jgi:hypothetical protein
MVKPGRPANKMVKGARAEARYNEGISGLTEEIQEKAEGVLEAKTVEDHFR